MKATVIVAIVGVVAVLGFAGIAAASGALTSSSSSSKGMGTDDGAGHKNMWQHMWEWAFGGDTTQTPHDFNYDYNYSYSYDVVSDCPASNCTCSG
jgi:hypothetical protein